MKWRSTRGSGEQRSTSEAIAQGLANDGGLFVPVVWPSIKIDPSWVDLSFADFAALLLELFFAEDPLQTHLSKVCKQAFDFSLPLVSVRPNLFLFELFHGPTGAFKDFGARFLALCCARVEKPSPHPLVLVATSGDTGGAVAAAFCAFSKIPVAILYPKGRVSPRQEKQLTVWGPQVQAFAVNGTFDDCQQIVKQALSSADWNARFTLTSANSINLGRLLPQMAYFAYASLRSKKLTQTAAQFLIPSGNTGNAVAALWAQRLGFPIARVHFAHNANRAVADYFTSGQFAAQPTRSTLANAMDVGNPSNFERVKDLYPNWADVKGVADACSVSDSEIEKTIQDVFFHTGQVLCPHTACAYFAATQVTGPSVVVATAHPAKFETLVEPLINKPIPIPESLNRLFELEGQYQTLEPNLLALQASLNHMERDNSR